MMASSIPNHGLSAGRVTEWNPRFVAYAASRGMTPEQVSAADRVTFPGGRFAGFMVWNSQRIGEFLRETGAHRSVVTRVGPYDEWLALRGLAEFAPDAKGGAVRLKESK
jgi:hypothetical protein